MARAGLCPEFPYVAAEDVTHGRQVAAFHAARWRRGLLCLILFTRGLRGLRQRLGREILLRAGALRARSAPGIVRLKRG
jgi:hypothetical protein